MSAIGIRLMAEPDTSVTFVTSEDSGRALGLERAAHPAYRHAFREVSMALVTGKPGYGPKRQKDWGAGK